ncbi:MAG: hypothetical protein AAF591_02035 [Verrucomicrobiota bacterium]
MKAIWVSLLAAGVFLGEEAGARMFTDDTGRQVEAELVGVRGENVVLSRGGRAAQWPIAKLSAADQAYVKEWQKNPPAVSRVTVRIWEREGMGEKGAMKESPELGPPKNIPLLKQTEEQAKYKHYDVDLTNESPQDASNLTMAYVMYVITPEGNVGSQGGSEKVDLIEAGKRKTLQTEGVTYVRTKTTSMTFSVDRIGGLSTGTDTSRASERFGGAWVRVYESDGSVVGEAKELHPEIERLDPAWTGPKVAGGSGGGGGGARLPAGGLEGMELPLAGSFEELEKLLGLLEEIKEKLPPGPGGSGPPKPPGFPGR